VTDILDALINFAALALLSAGTAGVGVLAPRVAGWLRLAHDDRVRAYLLAAVEAAVEYGQAEMRRRLLPDAGAATRDAHVDVVATLARDYVQSRVPDALAHFRIDDDGVDQMIRARLPRSVPAAQG